jgi:choline dehydrogenase-like flavoprotein
MPWWKFDRKNEFLRGYHIEPGGGRFMPVAGQFDDVCNHSEGYGRSLKENCRRSYGATIGMEALGEMIPNERTYCEIDPSSVDEWGIPVLRFHWRAGENEIKMANDMQETFRAIVEAAGGTCSTETSPYGPSPYGLYDGGTAIHESGTVRMGESPEQSALNKYCQTHDVKNVFVTDAGAFVTSPDKNPTLTILALTWRASEYLLEQSKQGNL